MARVYARIVNRAEREQIIDYYQSLAGPAMTYAMVRGWDDFGRDIAIALRRKLNGDTR